MINVDLCGSFAESLPDANYNTVPTALFALIQHQTKTRSKDWLLFITTRSDSQAVKPETMKRFVDWINVEIGKNLTIKQSLLDLGLLRKEEFEANMVIQSRLSAQSHSNAFAIGFGHWILNGLTSEAPPWRADMLEHVEYHVTLTDPSCDMVSLGFWCKKLSTSSPPDIFGIAKPIFAGDSPIEEVKRKCEEKINHRVATRKDLDKALYLQGDEYQLAFEDSAKLLAGAMYDEAAYRIWADEQRVKMHQFLLSAGLV